jgi:hypothetical protein
VKLWRDNGLSITVFALFVLFLLGQTWTGWLDENEERKQHHQAPMALSSYLTSGSFIEATSENWESEFLQMFGYVVLTAFLFQRGSAESKSPDEPAEVDRDPRKARHKQDAPAPVRKGGFVLRVYEYSLSLAFLALFILAFVLHGLGGTAAFNENNRLHGEPIVTFWEYLGTARFWFESFQNWQSEFFAIGAMVVLSIFLRQRGSPESKPVDSAHSETASA